MFYAGTGVNMHWIDTQGAGSVSPAGKRGDDEFSVSGNAVMYDTGRILKVGGSPGYDATNANANSYVIDINAGVSVRKLAPMAYRRAFHNSVVLPNGQVVIIGGQTYAVGFKDDNAVMVPELFDPVSETFTTLPAISVPRNYHSVALLLPDGRVMSAGGGLCGNGCAANHADMQILSPHYLFKTDGSAATRPVIASAPAAAVYGSKMAVSMDSEVSSFAIVRMGSNTHTVNNDQRRLSLTFKATSSKTYEVDVPSNPGWALPGQWMLFALNADGVPSVAKIVRIHGTNAPVITPIADQSSILGASAALQPRATSSVSGLVYKATGLPSGLIVDAATGRISGVPTSVGRSLVKWSVSDGVATVSTEFLWNVTGPGAIRFVKLEALSEQAGNPWTSMAELNVLDEEGRPLSRGNWSVSADSQELTGGGNPVANVIDGKPDTIWHTQYQGATPVLPHWVVVDLGGAFKVSGFRYMPRSGGGNGTIAKYRFYVSADGVNWGTPAAEGNLGDLGAWGLEKDVYLNNVARGKTALQSSSITGAASDNSLLARRAVDGNVDGVYGNGSVTHTAQEANAFWDVDLGDLFHVQATRLWNRSDCCADRLSNFYVLVSETPMTGKTLTQLLADTAVWRLKVPGTAPRSSLISVGVKGRYVRVQLAGNNFLSLAEVEVYGSLAVNRPPTIASLTPAAVREGEVAVLNVPAGDPDVDVLTYSATGLPTGLFINAKSGVISGLASKAGSYAVTIGVNDGRGGSASSSFTWTVLAPPPVVSPVLAPALVTGSEASYVATVTGQGAIQYNWSFGDGSADSGFTNIANIKHTYTAPGVYEVTLTAKDAGGTNVTRRFWQAVGGDINRVQAKASSSLSLTSASGAAPRLWVLNPDTDTIAVFDASPLKKVAEVAVGSQPRSVAVAPSGRVWVVNKGSATISVINPASLAVVQTISLPRASMPYGLIFGRNGQAFVALEAKGQLLKLDAAGAVLGSLSVGGTPRHLAMSPAMDRLLVSRFITRAQPGEATATIQTAVNGVKQGGELMVIDPDTLTLSRTVVLQHSDKADTTVSARGVPNYLGAAAIAPDGLSAWVPSKQDNIQRGTLRNGQNLNFESTVRAISSRVDLTTLSEDYAGRVDHDNSSLASAAIYHPSGAYVFVALETSRHVAVMDAVGKRELFRFDVGRAPQGLALSADGKQLYVQHFMDRSVGVFNLDRLISYGEASVPLVSIQQTVAAEKLPANVFIGKQLFYDARDPRLARDGYLSCASCHNDGASDGRTWDITGMGEGLRNTISLRGRAGGHGKLHWSGNFDEVQDFEGQIRALAQGTGLMSDSQFNTGTRKQALGDRKTGVSADLDALAAYVASLNDFGLSPHRAADGALTAQASTGRAVFAAQCISCHAGVDFTDSATGALRNVGTIKASSGQRLGGTLTGIDVPTLRDVWATAPYLHDGSAPTVDDAVKAHSGLTLSAGDLAAVSDYVRQIDRTEGAVAPLVPVGTGAGLKGEYYNKGWFGALNLASTHMGENPNFDWGTARPDSRVNADNFVVKWSGTVQAEEAGLYRFQTLSDDGVRVWVNGVLLIDNWTAHGATTNTSGTIALELGKRYTIKIDYYDGTGGAVMRLTWQKPTGGAFTSIPTNRLYLP